ncbi:tetratricopeptide repeat protein [Caldithrix abyssi]
MKFYNILPDLKRTTLILLLLAFAVQLSAQTDSRLRMAMLFKNSGSYEEALELYLQIYKAGRTSNQVINDIQFCYEKLKRYEDLIAFLQNLIKKSPARLEYQVKLGKAYYLNDNRDQAFALWNDLLQAHGHNAYLYRLLGNVFIELRLYDKAIETYQLGIRKTKSLYSLYREIALLHRAQLDYGQAAVSYLKYLEHFPKQYSFVNGQIIAMSSDSSAVRQMIEAIEKYLKTRGDQAGVRQILADLYLRNGDFKHSFAIYLDLHKKAPRTNYLLQFVHKASQNQAYEFAVKGLKLLMEQASQPGQKQQYAFQLARNYFAWAKKLSARQQEKQARQTIKLAMQVIDGLLHSKTKTSYRWNALELRGDIYFNYFQDIDQAIKDYQNYLQAPLNAQQLDRVRFKLAKSHLARGDIAAAERLLRQIRTKKLRSLVEYTQAELLFYVGRLTPAQKAFADLSVKLSPGDSLKNNVLQRLLLLNHIRQDSSTLAEMGRAEFLIAQKKLSQAANIFKELALKNGPLSPQCAERAVHLFIKLEKWEEAQSLIAHALQHSPDYVNMDRLLFTLGGIQERQKQPQKAFNTYRLIITRYPDSFFVEQARERARWLKEKLKQEQVP